MGKRWRKYSVGKYRLGALNGQAVVCWEDEKGPHRRRLGFASTEVEARALLDGWVSDVEFIKTKKAKSKTVAELWAYYRSDREKDGKIVLNFDNDWKALGPRFGALEVDAVTADICRDYAAERDRAGKSASTIWTELTRLRSCLNWAMKRRVIDRAPYVWVPTKPDGRTRVMTEAEVRALLDACKVPHVRLFVILAITTGGRSGALLDLTWDRVDFEAGTIDLRKAVRINPLTKRAQKGRAIVPMGNEARAALHDAKLGALTDHVIEWDGEPVKCILKGFKSAATAAKLTGVSPHTLRHTCLTWLDEGSIPMERIAKMAGHRDQRTTARIYAKPSVEVLRPAANVLDMKIKRKG